MEEKTKIDRAAELISKARVLIFCINVDNKSSNEYLEWGSTTGVYCLIYSPENEYMKRLARQTNIVIIEIDANEKTRKQSSELTRQYGATRIRIEEVPSIPSRSLSGIGSLVASGHHVCISGENAQSVLTRIREEQISKYSKVFATRKNIVCLGGMTTRTRLSGDALRETAQCRACLATFPRSSFDWSKKQQVKIGEDDSWGNWNVYTNFVECRECGKLAVSDETIIKGK